MVSSVWQRLQQITPVCAGSTEMLIAIYKEGPRRSSRQGTRTAWVSIGTILNFQTPPYSRGASQKKNMSDGTTRAYPQIIHRWTAYCLHPCKPEMSDKTQKHTDGQCPILRLARFTFARQLERSTYKLQTWFCRNLKQHVSMSSAILQLCLQNSWQHERVSR